MDHPHRSVGAAETLFHRRLGLVHPQAAYIHGVGLGAHLGTEAAMACEASEAMALDPIGTEVIE